MSSRAVTFSDVSVFNTRAYGARDYRRTIFGGAVLGLGGVSAAALMAGTAAVAAAWMVSGSLARNPEFRARAPFALETAVLPAPPQRLVDPPDMFGGALASANPAYAQDDAHTAQLSPADPVAASPDAVAATSQPPRHQTVALIRHVPLPSPRPLALMRQARVEMAPPPAVSAAPMTTQVHLVAAEMTPGPIAGPMALMHLASAHFAPTSLAPAHSAPAHLASKPIGIGEQKEIAALAFSPPASSQAAGSPETTGSVGSTGAMKVASAGPIDITAKAVTKTLAKTVAKPAAPQLAYNSPDVPPLRDSRTAIYDIVAHTVYMPDGERLEAHSGLGRMLDDPHYITQKGRGPTPPNTYDLTLRAGSFHGVQALRLNPAADSRMYGRDGILAHTYMLGPSGQSFGCVSFKDYSEFLRAFQRGEVRRIVVVPHLQNPPPGVRASNDGNERFAFNLKSLF
jgi:hypothetical protein